MSLTVVGSMAFDAIETPYGKSDKIIGGAATYIAWAASQFTRPIDVVSVVGGDFPISEMKALEEREVSLEGVEVKKDQKSFFWSGRYHEDMNTRDTLVTELNVLADFEPKVPAGYQNDDYLILGNLNPSVQLSVISQMKKRPKLVALDTMNFWMDIAMEELKEAISKVDILLINDSESRQLSGEYSLVKAARKIFEMGPRFLVIKKGEHGALLFHEERVFFAPGLPLDDVFDPTGAGDTFAGGFMGHLAHTDDLSFDNMKSAIIAGSALASFCVEEFGAQKLREINEADINRRIQKFVELVHFDSDLK